MCDYVGYITPHAKSLGIARVGASRQMVEILLSRGFCDPNFFVCVLKLTRRNDFGAVWFIGLWRNSET